MTKVIEISIELPKIPSDKLLEHLFELPVKLRPTHFSIGEDDPRIPLSSSCQLPKALRGRRSGYFLYGPGFSFDISIDHLGDINLMGDLQVPPDQVRELFIHLASLGPGYGYAACPEERLARNRVFHQLGPNKIEAWVGRSSDQWLPGLYWLNLISVALATRHNIPLDLLAGISREHLALENGVHLFRFYDEPGDWARSNLYALLPRSIPRLFDIENVKERLPSATSVLELMAELDRW